MSVEAYEKNSDDVKNKGDSKDVTKRRALPTLL